MQFKRLQELRTDMDFSQQTVADYLNIARSTYSEYELGRARIPADVLDMLADYYGVSADYLMGRTDERKPYPRSTRNWDIIEEAQKEGR